MDEFDKNDLDEQSEYYERLKENYSMILEEIINTEGVFVEEFDRDFAVDFLSDVFASSTTGELYHELTNGAADSRVCGLNPYEELSYDQSIIRVNMLSAIKHEEEEIQQEYLRKVRMVCNESLESAKMIVSSPELLQKYELEKEDMDDCIMGLEKINENVENYVITMKKLDERLTEVGMRESVEIAKESDWISKNYTPQHINNSRNVQMLGSVTKLQKGLSECDEKKVMEGLECFNNSTQRTGVLLLHENKSYKVTYSPKSLLKYVKGVLPSKYEFFKHCLKKTKSEQNL